MTGKEKRECLGRFVVAISDVLSDMDAEGFFPRGEAGSREASLAITNLQQAIHWLNDAAELSHQND
jgi:hypothetical protein